MVDNATMLAEAQAALHQLQTGQAVASITKSDGSGMQFNQADISKLQNYIKNLQGIAGTSRRGCVRFFG